MKSDSLRDSLYATPKDKITNFAFDESVAKVFPDMIRRSVPGYGTIISMIGVLAEKYVQPESRVYDLGCSLGAATLSMRHHIRQSGCRIVAVDNSIAMTKNCHQNIIANESVVPVEVICADIRDVKIESASMVVLNFTLQFLEPDERQHILIKIYNGLLPGGILILSEKIKFADQYEQLFNEEMHLEFKRANGYSDLEISQKRTALEKVLIPDTLPQHQLRLIDAGFVTNYVWFHCFNFASLIAIK